MHRDESLEKRLLGRVFRLRQTEQKGKAQPQDAGVMPAHEFRIGFAIALLNGLNDLILVDNRVRRLKQNKRSHATLLRGRLRLMDMQVANKQRKRAKENPVMDIWNALVLNMMTLKEGDPLVEKRCGSLLEGDLPPDKAGRGADRRTQEYLAYLYHPAL